MVSIFTRTLIIYILLSVSMKTMGKREIGELDVSELVSTLLISEIAAIPIDDPDLPLMNAVIPVLFILSLEILLSYAKTRSNKLKRFVEGEAVFLIYRGTLNQKALKENRISINEFMAEIRSQGVGDIGEIDYAILEQSGKISILMEKDTKISHVLILDGEYNAPVFESAGFSKDKVSAELFRRKIARKDVFLMSVDDENRINIIKKDKKK